MSEFFTILFGEYSTAQLLAFVVFFIVGYVIYGLTETSGRDVESQNTPRKWSWKFWFQDNWKRYLTTILCTFILFRFYSELSGHPFGNFDAVTFGMIGDGVAATIKNRVKGIGVDREKIMANMTDEEKG
jgi:hypothetical protein